jgi:hypothetical protein
MKMGIRGLQFAKYFHERRNQVAFNMVSLDINKTLYHEMVGLFIHSTNTCPNIAFAIRMVNRFMSQPQETHLKAIKHIFEYIKNIEDYGFIFEQGAKSVLNGHMNEIRLATRGQGTQQHDMF